MQDEKGKKNVGPLYTHNIYKLDLKRRLKNIFKKEVCI